VIKNNKQIVSPERLLYKEGYRFIAGIDEAGRGPLAGPVVAAAVILPKGWSHPDIKDSKCLSPKKRNELFQIITTQAISWAIGIVDAQEIDRTNILKATIKAMEIAVKKLIPTPEYLLIDGLHGVSVGVPQSCIPKGDSQSLLIASASIIAKVKRDKLMEEFHCIYPHYNFAKNKGYGTREHLNAISVYGCCPIHRKSFKGVAYHKGQEKLF